MVRQQGLSLQDFGVYFDTWFSEQSLHDRGLVADRIDGLQRTGVADEEPYRTKLKLGKGGVVEEETREPQTEGTPEDDEDSDAPRTSHLAPAEGATLWLRSTKFGDDMDRVLRRRDGRLTYIASDVSYHENKLGRPENATKMITILGPDHHGYIGRLTAVVAALLRGPEDTPEANAAALATAKEKLEVVIYQLVRFLKDGKPAPMRKRDGNIYELRDLIDELGKNLAPDGTKDEQRTTGCDVARFFYLMRSHDTTMDFDIDLATQQSDENPVFYAQYAHARICSVLRKAQESVEFGAESGEEDHSTLLVHPRETALVKKVLDLPWEVGRIAEEYGVHRLTTYAVELARTYHHFYDACRVIQPDQPELTQARLALCRATRIALKATFDLLGVSAPERLERRAETSPPPGERGRGKTSSGRNAKPVAAGWLVPAREPFARRRSSNSPRCDARRIEDVRRLQATGTFSAESKPTILLSHDPFPLRLPYLARGHRRRPADRDVLYAGREELGHLQPARRAQGNGYATGRNMGFVKWRMRDDVRDSRLFRVLRSESFDRKTEEDRVEEVWVDPTTNAIAYQNEERTVGARSWRTECTFLANHVELRCVVWGAPRRSRRCTPPKGWRRSSDASPL